jgi:NAD(P)-dependent dehydrogenase (short-subunit alcohol dehydrogenase family)
MPLAEPPAAGVAMLPAGSFAGEVVAITGGGTGLGKAMAIEFARLGAAVAILSRGDAHRAAGSAAVAAVGGRAYAASVDVRDPEAIARAFDQVEAALGPVGVLINNAAGNFPVAAEALSPNGWRAVTQIVLDGTFFCSREFAQRRIAAARPGTILNVVATYAWTGGPGAAHSAAAKAGVVNLTLTLSVEWAAHGIRVNALAPGLFPHDDMAPQMRANRPEGYAAVGATIPAGRVGQVHELGWAATYLCSPFAAYVSGHTFVIDGANWQRRGLHMPAYEPVPQQLQRKRGRE